ncbi:MAG TPA: DEAD/DEAH box helicase [Isosphaeraceae bacterium]|nr:DEAD/DEAH box helicase [Isosphaeraceae bacterium]
MTTETEPTVEQTEAYRTLLARVGRKSPKIPADVLVRHVLGCVPPHEWPARLEAMDALLRRLESAKRDELRIDARPENGRLLGSYATRRRNSAVRPYCTVLSGIEPIEGRCDCPDFLKNSLGVCKHLLIVLEHLHSKPRLLRRALKEQGQVRVSIPTGLHWDPIRPLTGIGDWLERVVLFHRPGAKATRAERWSQALKWFRPGDNGALVLKQSFLDEPPKRRTLVEALLGLLPSGARGIRHDPALRALLIGERERLRRGLKQALTPSELKAAIKGLKRPLYPYQREGVERFLAEGRLLLADDMGLGKTAQAIAAADILWRARRIRRGLIIAPASLKPQWAREWALFSDLPVLVVDGMPAERQALYDAHGAGFFIINYEQLIRDLETIRRWGPDLVVLDEAQRIKNWATKTALSVKGLAPPYRLVLTGTPMENRIEELASVVEWVDDMALEPKWRLNALHAVYADGRREVTGVRHLDTLRDRLRGCMVRRVRQDVLDQLPPRTDIRVPVEMTEAQQGEHDALIPPILALMQRSKVRPLTQAEFLRLMSLLTTQRIISNGLAQLRFEEVWPAIRPYAPEESAIKSLSSPKLLELRQLVRQLALEQNRKVVVFSQWRRMLTLAHWAVSDLLAEHGLRAGFFTGAEGQRRRTQNIVEFHDDPRYRLLFASDAGGVGLNLQHASNCVINLELPWNPAVLEQRIGRIYRLGQKRPIDVYNLVCEAGIESRIAGLVGSKQAFFKGLFDGDTDAVQFEQSGSFLSRVEKIYEPSTLSISVPAPGTDGAEPLEPDDTDLDGEAADPFEQLLNVADESTDQVNAPSESGLIETGPAPPQGAPPGTGAPPREQDHARPMPTPAIGDVRQLFSQLQIRREGDGKVVIEAPAEAASTLSALFEGMAALLQSVSRPPGRDGPA